MRLATDRYNALATARVAAGLKQRQLAAACGVSQQCIGLLEKGQRNPSPALAQRLSRMLRTTPKRLFPPEPIDGVLVTPIQLK